MKFIVLSILLLCIINYPLPYKEINVEEILAKKREEEKKIIQNKRRLNNGKVVYKNPESIITFHNDYIIETISISVKAEGGVISDFYLYSTVARDISILSCELKMKDDKGKEISTFSNLANYSTSSSSLHINTYLPENYEQLVKTTFKGFYSQSDLDVLYKQILISVPTFYRNNTHCKYIFNVGENSVNVGLKNGNFPVFNDSAFIYDDLCPNYLVYDILRITARQITWNSYIEITADVKEVEEKNPDTIILAASFDFYNGTNFNFTNVNISYTPLKTGKRRNDSYINSYQSYMVSYYNFYNPQKFYFISNITFSSSPNFWNITDEIIKNNLKNTSTNLTISFVKEILSNNTSNKPDYYKIGKWVYENINYDKAHSTASNPDDILIKRKGVCHHFTVLYNALLNSIGIKTLYASGEAIKNINDLGGENHAWTVAEINGKWIGLDATWNIFSGKLPQCHLFKKIDGAFEPFAIAIPQDKVSTNVIEETKLIEIVNLTSKKNYNYNSENNSQKFIQLNILFLFIILLNHF